MAMIVNFQSEIPCLWVSVNVGKWDKNPEKCRWSEDLTWPRFLKESISYNNTEHLLCFDFCVCVCVREREQATSLWLSTAARQKEQIDQRRTKHYVPESSLEKGEWAPRGGNLCSYSSGTLNWSSHLDYIIRGVIGLEQALCSQVYLVFTSLHVDLYCY